MVMISYDLNFYAYIPDLSGKAWLVYNVKVCRNMPNLGHNDYWYTFSMGICIGLWARAQQFLQDCMCVQSNQNLCRTLWAVKGQKRLQADSEDWSACADAQADLSFLWAHMQSCRKCRAQF